MKQILPMLLLLPLAVHAKKGFPRNEISINGFRNPSAGVEYRHRHLSVHAGYYTTAFKPGEYTNFVKTGLTYWFLPVGNAHPKSSFYAGMSYMRGLTRDYKDENAMAFETGFRWTVWRGLNLRIGAIAVAAPGKDLRINPTPGISYSISLKKRHS